MNCNRTTVLAEYPNHSFIGEESYSAGEEKRFLLKDGPAWIIDPIDGTVNMASCFVPFWEVKERCTLPLTTPKEARGSQNSVPMELQHLSPSERRSQRVIVSVLGPSRNKLPSFLPSFSLRPQGPLPIECQLSILRRVGQRRTTVAEQAQAGIYLQGFKSIYVQSSGVLLIQFEGVPGLPTVISDDMSAACSFGTPWRRHHDLVFIPPGKEGVYR